MSTRQPLSTLAQTTPSPTVITATPKKQSIVSGNFVNLLLWFLIIAAVVFFILYLLKPDMVQRRDAVGIPTGEVDSSKALIGAIIVAIIIVFVIYIFKMGQH